MPPARSARHCTAFSRCEAGGGFGMPQDVDRSFDRLVDGLQLALAGWAGEVAVR